MKVRAASRLFAVSLVAIATAACSGIIPQGGPEAGLSVAALPIPKAKTKPTPKPTKPAKPLPVKPAPPSPPIAPAPPAPPATPQVPQPLPGIPVVPPPLSTTVPREVPTLIGETGRALGVAGGPEFAAFNINDETARRALIAFRSTCPALLKRKDLSGLTEVSDWAASCAAAASADERGAGQFFANNFEVVQVGNGKAFATGYYEPEILGSRTKSAKYATPIYARPPELVEIDLGAFSETLKGKKLRGKVEGKTFVPYVDRTQIETGALQGRGLEIAWAADPVDFFVLQVQGSGQLRLPDGSVMRIGYDGQNGKDYTGIGKLMKARGILGPGKGTMDDIAAWLRANPEEGRAIMRENKSWVFFRELTGPGALGALGMPVTGKTSVATDPMFVPLGAPVLLSGMERAEANGLWVAQDTGGAIKGSNRFDTFWGAGPLAKSTAGGMSAHGAAWLLLPKGVLQRLQENMRPMITPAAAPTSSGGNGGTTPHG